MDQLKPCPFCGGEAFMESWVARKGFEANVHCNSCSAMVYTITYDFEEQAEKNAIEQWNRREPIDKVVEQLEEMKILCNEIAIEAIEEMNDLQLQVAARNQVVAFAEAIEIVKGDKE